MWGVVIGFSICGGQFSECSSNITNRNRSKLCQSRSLIIFIFLQCFLAYSFYIALFSQGSYVHGYHTTCVKLSRLSFINQFFQLLLLSKVLGHYSLNCPIRIKILADRSIRDRWTSCLLSYVANDPISLEQPCLYGRLVR